MTGRTIAAAFTGILLFNALEAGGQIDPNANECDAPPPPRFGQAGQMAITALSPLMWVRPLTRRPTKRRSAFNSIRPRTFSLPRTSRSAARSSRRTLRVRR
jgi:hypothetical protein